MRVRRNSLNGLALTFLLIVAMCATVVAGEEKYDESTPMEELKTASDGGDAEAMAVYGMRLLQAEGDDVDVTGGLEWLNKAGDAGETQAWYALGVVYANEMGVERDFDKAIGYWRKGAELGDADCQTSMGMVYQAGEKIPTGLKADPAEAAKWYGMAAEQGHTEAIQHLAMMNAAGMGIEKNEEEAIRLFRKGAELGNADCCWGLGQCYLDGKGVQQDSVMAYALFSASLAGVAHPEQKKAMTAARDKMGEALTEEQLKKAGPIIEEWEAKVKQ
ncbi:MAG: sel1 repeat family protein [Candidatus Zixiibacteriota bacterium]|nr:MAG: sel1 repeat family protein [candidate division Zixibacteria bacterium]